MTIASRRFGTPGFAWNESHPGQLAWSGSSASGPSPSPARAPLTADVQAWIRSIDRSAIELVADEALRRRFLQEIDWSREYFPGNLDAQNKRAPGRLAEQLFNAMARVTPERRVPRGVRFHDVTRVVVTVPGQTDQKLFPEARDAFVRMRAAAATDGVQLQLISSWRSVKRQEAARSRQTNPNAVAPGISAHNYGLAIDLNMRVPGLTLVNISTRARDKMANMVRMYRSPNYKWLAINASRFGWFPYKREPWHWEYNPPGLKERFEGAAATREFQFENTLRPEFEPSEYEWGLNPSPINRQLLNNFNRGMAGFRLEGETAEAINDALKLNPKGGYVKGSTARRKLDEAITTVPGACAAQLHAQLKTGQDPVGKLFRHRLHPETQRVLLAILAKKAQELQRLPQANPPTPQPSSLCQLFLPAKAGSYEDYVVAQTTGRITLLINGRNSGGAGPDDNVDEAFDRMQEAVEALQPADTIYLAAWHFDPTVPLTNPGPPGVKTWGELFQKKANDGVKIRIIMTDFAPIAQGLHAKLYNDFLPSLNKLISNLSTTKRDNLKYIVSRHPATQFTIHVATHHQKFMLLKKRGATTAFCGGLDIAYMRTPAYWTTPNYPWLWHDLHSKLEGRIARDLELEFVLRWNREKNASVVPALNGWKPLETLVQGAANLIDLRPDSNQQKLQMLRTVSVQGPGSQIQTIRRDDIWQGYLRLISCATRFIYMENQYFREPRMADAIVNQAKAQPELIVIIVVPEQLDDPNDAIKRHGNWLQHNFFRRLFAGVPAKRRRVYTMFHRIIHSKLVMVDDHALTIGSANANPRGFFMDTELNVMLDDANTVTSFRHRLWSHNLGVPQNTVAGWTVRDFMPRWDATACTNLGLKGTPDEVTGEGVIPFDPLLEKGQQQLHIQDVLTEVKDLGRRDDLGYRRFIPSRW